MIFNSIVAPSITPGLEFTRPPVEESSFKPRTLDMKAKAGQTSRYKPAGAYIGWSACRECDYSGEVLIFVWSQSFQIRVKFNKMLRTSKIVRILYFEQIQNPQYHCYWRCGIVVTGVVVSLITNITSVERSRRKRHDFLFQDF